MESYCDFVVNNRKQNVVEALNPTQQVGRDLASYKAHLPFLFKNAIII